MWRSKILSPLALTFILTVTFACHSHAEVSTSDPLWDWKYDAIERLSLAFGERTVSNTRPMSRLEMAGTVLKLAAKAKAEAENDYYGVLLKKLEDDLREEIKNINEGADGSLKIKPLRWVRAKAVHSDEPLQLENDYGFKAGDVSIRGEVSTSGTWGVVGYELRPQYNLFRDDEEDGELDLHSGYLVLWLKNLEVKVGKDAMWWGPGRHGNWVLTNNAPAFEMVKFSNAVTSVPPGPLKFLGDAKFTAFLGRLSEQEISYINNGVTVTEEKMPLFTGFRLDFSPSRYIEIGGAQTIEFIDRGGRGYSLDYISKTLIPSYGSNEEEGTSGPVANRVIAFDISLNIDGNHGFMKGLNLKGMKAYWTWGGETMVIDDVTGLPRTCFTGNLFGLYLDSGRTEFRAEYASNFDAGTSWYDHYQFTEGYRNDGFILGHNHMDGNSKDLFLNISHPFTDNVSAALNFDRREQRTDGSAFREDIYGLSIDAFMERGGKAGLSYEYRESAEGINNVLVIEGVYKF